MTDVIWLSLAIFASFSVWALVWAWRIRLASADYRWRVEHECECSSRNIARLHNLMQLQKQSFEEMNKPPELPGDEWKNGGGNSE
jgi:hypothetical protein